MPIDPPTPITPEGKRAAERMRLIFYSIAIGNIVLVAIVMWQRIRTEKGAPTGVEKPAAAMSPALK